MKKIVYLFASGIVFAIIGAILFWGFGKVESGMIIWAIGGMLVLLSMIFDYKTKLLF